jgi:uncharacterized protein (TIGR02246 family)
MNYPPKMSSLMFCIAVVFGLLTTAARMAHAQEAKEAAKTPAAPGPGNTDRQADQQAIRATAEEFTKAFNAADAKTVAALWTEQGEYESDDGVILCGRGAIEAAFAAHFKGRPEAKTSVQIDSIRFPSRDVALEEGITSTVAKGALPSSARYRVVHVREDGAWRIALCREWAAGESRMIDLDFLIGTWRSEAKEHQMTITFSRDKESPFIIGEFAATVGGKSVPLGTIKIGVDPATRQFMSWHFDADGGYGHGVWLRERNHWAIDSRGVQGDSTQVASVNVLSRFGDDELGWRTIDRMVGGKAQPDPPPIRLKRLTANK